MLTSITLEGGSYGSAPAPHPPLDVSSRRVKVLQCKTGSEPQLLVSGSFEAALDGSQEAVVRAHEIIHRLHLDEDSGIDTALAIAAFIVIIVAFYFLSFAVGGALQP